MLRDLRDRPGSPITQVRSAIGVDADWYALTSQNKIETDPIRLQRARVEDVHPAWHVLGHQHRRVYELIAYHGLTNRADLYAAARTSKSTVNATIIELTVAGLIKTTGRGTVATGPTSLDDIATAHHLDDINRKPHRRIPGRTTTVAHLARSTRHPDGPNHTERQQHRAGPQLGA